MNKLPLIKKLPYLIATGLLLLLAFSGYAAKGPKNQIIVYPAPAGEVLSQAYTVSAGGRNVPVYTAKIAANDRPDQFKGISDIKNSHKYFDTAAFAYFDMQGKATVT